LAHRQLAPPEVHLLFDSKGDILKACIKVEGIAVNVHETQDNFWREALDHDPKDSKGIERKYTEFMEKVQTQIGHLTQTEQDSILTGLIKRNSDYMEIAKKDRNSLRLKLGMPAQSSSNDRLVQVATETAVRATVWHSIAAIFRLIR
jgi:hypothetical protein